MTIMRPLRLLISLASFVVATTLLLVLIPRKAGKSDAAPQQEPKSKLGALFSFHTPLFPPSAIISLTDDNSTFFLARPAAFGPLLPSKGLSGQLWIGSGFGDDTLGRGGLHAGAEGELGCSDVPGWDATAGKVGKQRHQKAVVHDLPPEQGPVAEQVKFAKRDKIIEDAGLQGTANDDGTDDHLHSPSPGTDPSKSGRGAPKQQHADIESLQETAEIAGKVVLLSRGGCGFLEKVKWAQRRGGVALIVGDDVVGGPLVTMYAKGDTSNVTIPALFTSHTTAHLLSSLIPPDGLLNGAPVPSTGETKVPEQQVGQGKGVSSSGKALSKSRPKANPPVEDIDEEDRAAASWFNSLFGRLGSADGASSVSRRPPSSGRLEWVRVADFHDEEATDETKGKTEKAKGSTVAAPERPKDDFVIGVQDWRDPDVLKPNKLHDTSTHKKLDAPKASKKTESNNEKSLKGGSITPGSGEYEKPGSTSSHGTSSKDSKKNWHKDKSDNDSRGWFSHLFSSKRDDVQPQSNTIGRSATHAKQPQQAHNSGSSPKAQSSEQAFTQAEPHEGLWVTLTPTNISSSPFFDTLLVLVVSPLITLTVVYALLLLRSRIRRRRWRAPKSVVERLPVRTYHSIPSESASTSALASAAETTPLLEHSTSNDVRSARRVLNRSRANSRASPRRLRSFTTSQVDATAPSSSRPSRPPIHSRISNNSSNSTSTGSNDEEKRDAGLAEWRRRYGGRQRECVVCLEEYVDGVSRVMSLPCGHEFHVECM